MEISVLTGIDLVIITAYLLFTVGLGMYLGREIRTGKDYFLAGRRLPWWAVGMSMVVSDIGAMDIIGMAGLAYLYGIAVANFDLIGAVPVMIICAFIFISYLWRSGAYTIPEFLEKRFNLGVRIVSALIWGIFMACNLGIMLYVTGVMIETMVGWSITTSIFICAALIGLYTLVGGLTAVVYTDVLQCIMLFIGTTLVVFLGLDKVGGISGLTEAIYSMGDQYNNHFSLVLPADSPTPFPYSGILLGLGMVLAPAYWFGNQAIVQRALACRSEFEAKAAFIWGASLKIFLPFIMVVPGMIALVLYKDNVPNADSALPTLIRDILPTGLIGIFFAAFLAALMSSVDSYLNSTSTMWTKDIYQRLFRPHEDDRHYLIVGRILTLVFVIWGIFFAIWVQGKSESIYNVFQTMLALFQGPSLALIVLGILWWRTTGSAAFIGLIAGLLCSTTLLLTHKYASEPLFQTEDPFLFIAMWSFIVSLVSMVVISLVTHPAPDEKLVGLVFRYKGRQENANSR